MSTATLDHPTKKNDGNRIASQVFAQTFQAYLECSDNVQAVIRDMSNIYNATDASEEEREAAVSTIAEAMFPAIHNGALGACLEDCEADAPLVIKVLLKELDREEATFGNRVLALLEEKQVTQAELATAIGVKQPAISMLLTRASRPQRRTVEKIAAALKVSPEEIWPGIKGD